MNTSRLLNLAVLGLVPALPALPAAQQVGAQPELTAAGCQNKIMHEPVVSYDVTGSTFAGPFHEHFTVFNNGFASLSRLTNFSGADAQTANISAADVAQLRTDLAATGAYSLCDITASVSDIPLTTITVFRGNGGMARTNTVVQFRVPGAAPVGAPSASSWSTASRASSRDRRLKRMMP
jgi:hypothetical protein